MTLSSVGLDQKQDGVMRVIGRLHYISPSNLRLLLLLLSLRMSEIKTSDYKC